VFSETDSAKLLIGGGKKEVRNRALKVCKSSWRWLEEEEEAEEEENE